MHKPTLAAVAAIAALAACSSAPKPQPEPPKTDPVVEQPKPDPGPPPIAEAELCPKLIQRFRDTAQMDPSAAEKVIAVVEQHCPLWPETVRRCLATAPDDDQTKCMDDLDAAERDKFVGDMMAVLQPPPECDELGAVALWYELPDTVSESDRSITDAAIRPVVIASCREGAWSAQVKQCVGGASMKPRVCLDDPAAVDATVGPKLDAEIKRRTDLYVVAAAFKPTDKKIGCDKVAAAHYGAAQWKTKLADRPKKDKTKLIKASTTAFTKACKGESWTPFVRACVVSAKSEEERGWCLDGERWAYPASEVEPHASTQPSSTGIAECDDYIAIVQRYAACDKLPQAAKDATMKAIETMRASWDGNMTDDAKQAAAGACKAGIDGLRQGAQALGCSI